MVSSGLLFDSPPTLELGSLTEEVVMSSGFLDPVAAAGVPIINLHP
jgi:hypothetical protein